MTVALTGGASNDDKLSAILAEMRDRADTIVNGRAITERNFVPQETVEDWADRTEAAAKRDCIEAVVRAATQGVKLTNEKYANMPIGNASALRAALEYVLQFDATDEAAEEDGLTDAERIAEYADHIEECQKKARAALATPPRNCDRFVDELDAQLAFLNEVWLISVDRETMLERDKYKNWTDEMRTRYGRWLLAQATEQKGDNNGR